MRAIMLLVVALVATPLSKPELKTRVFPTISMAIPGKCSEVSFFAEIKGPESEEWYCPKVEWLFPSGVVASEESDCPPFERRHECWPPQGPECGVRGWYRHPVTGQIIEKVKECACTVIGYPRMWRRTECVPGSGDSDIWYSLAVRFSKNGKTLDRQDYRFMVQ